MRILSVIYAISGDVALSMRSTRHTTGPILYTIIVYDNLLVVGTVYFVHGMDIDRAREMC